MSSCRTKTTYHRLSLRRKIFTTALRTGMRIDLRDTQTTGFSSAPTGEPRSQTSTAESTFFISGGRITTASGMTKGRRCDSPSLRHGGKQRGHTAATLFSSSAFSIQHEEPRSTGVSRKQRSVKRNSTPRRLKRRNALFKPRTNARRRNWRMLEYSNSRCCRKKFRGFPATTFLCS